MWALVLYRLAPGRLVSERLGGSISTAVHSVAATSRVFFFEISATSVWNGLLGAFAELRKATDCNFVMSVFFSVRMEQLGFHWESLHVIWYLSIFRKKSVEKLNVWLNLTRITGTVHEEVCAFVISRWILLGMRSVLCLEMMWKNMVEPGNLQVTVCGACCFYAGWWRFLSLSLSRSLSHARTHAHAHTRTRFMFGDDVEKYGRTRHSTGDSMRRVLFVCWMTKVSLSLSHTHTRARTRTHTRARTHALSLSLSLSLSLRICNPCWFPMRSGYAKTPNFVHTLPVF